MLAQPGIGFLASDGPVTAHASILPGCRAATGSAAVHPADDDATIPLPGGESGCKRLVAGYVWLEAGGTLRR